MPINKTVQGNTQTKYSSKKQTQNTAKYYPVQSPLTTFHKEMISAYSTMLPSPRRENL